jgi:enoyl-[acyl-carrier-protein] reductase (NADH)
MAALDALLKRLDISTAPRQIEDAVVIHQSSGPVIMSVNQSNQNINDTANRINATFDRIDVLLESISQTSKQILETTKELLRIFKQPGFMEAMNAKKKLVLRMSR